MATAESETFALDPTPRDATRLTLYIRATAYAVRPVPIDPGSGASKCWELRKSDGDAYHVSEHATGPQCTCPDWEYRRNGLDRENCKHIKAAAQFGLISTATAPLRSAVADPFDDFPRRVRRGETGPPPSARYTEREDGPGMATVGGLRED